MSDLAGWGAGQRVGEADANGDVITVIRIAEAEIAQISMDGCKR